MEVPSRSDRFQPSPATVLLAWRQGVNQQTKHLSPAAVVLLLDITPSKGGTRPGTHAAYDARTAAQSLSLTVECTLALCSPRSPCAQLPELKCQEGKAGTCAATLHRACKDVSAARQGGSTLQREQVRKVPGRVGASTHAINFHHSHRSGRAVETECARSRRVFPRVKARVRTCSRLL